MKVKVIKAGLSSYWYADKIGEVFEVEESTRRGFDYNVANDDRFNKHYIDKGDVEIVKDNKEFDMKKEAWFIPTPTPEISKLVQEWLFEQGFVWNSGDQEVLHTDTKFLENSLCHKERFVWGDEQEGQEIKLSFKTIIDSVEYPEVETQQDKQIRELEETIAKASEQIKQLKGEKK